MGKFHGSIGFASSANSVPGVFTEVITEREYTGDILRTSQRWQQGQNLNDNLTLSTRISIVADQFAFLNLSTIKYATWAGVNWSVTTVEHQRPRLILTLGGVFNG